MGTWGTGPFDNDTAGDMVARLSKDVTRVVEAKTDRTARYRYHSARAAVQFMMISHGTDILGGPSLELAVKALARMRSDTECLADYRDPKKIAKALSEEMAAVIARMRACKGCQRKYKKAEYKGDFAELLALVKAANAVEIPKPARRKRARRVSRSEMKAIKAKIRRREAAKKAKKKARKKAGRAR